MTISRVRCTKQRRVLVCLSHTASSFTFSTRRLVSCHPKSKEVVSPEKQRGRSWFNSHSFHSAYCPQMLKGILGTIGSVGVGFTEASCDTYSGI